LKKVHLIAIGGAIMHNLAIALSRKGYEVTGSDDAIYDPAKTNLEKEGLLPSIGWNSNFITSDIDIVILGMHARKDNPELARAKALGLKIMSFPEFVANESKDKKRVVIAGSHGKTTTTAMIMHVLSALDIDFDYLVGSSIEGFDLSVKLSDAPLIIIEGDEYLSSPLDMRSKFVWYNPDLSIITGIAYDHINVFPTFDSYIKTFKDFVETHKPQGQFFWYEDDEYLQAIASSTSVKNESYTTPKNFVKEGITTLIYKDKNYALNIVGNHNLENLEAASLVCEQLGVDRDVFFEKVRSFDGAGRRMEKIYDQNGQVVYRDFAHSPSKLTATTNAVKDTYKDELLAVFELHTFSSLNKDFLPLYKDAMKGADQAIVFYNSAVFEHKKMEPMSESFVHSCFGDVSVITNTKELEKVVLSSFKKGSNILLMSSGKFENADFSFIG
jgi:UDP-N-acetylmuramate: L-alanyl-gamma-D-glutamyl-meso-diaminopimelate ligase